GSSRARSACDKVQKAVATAPAAGSSTPPAPPAEEAAPSSAALPPLASKTPPAPPQNQDMVIVTPVFPEPAAGSNNGSDVALGKGRGDGRIGSSTGGGGDRGPHGGT